MKRFKKLIKQVRIAGTLMMVPIALAMVASPGHAQRDGFRVVVHSTNPVTSISADDVSGMFQKRVTGWDNGQAVLPVDLPESSPAREHFTRIVHDKSISAIKAHWHRQIFWGRGVPPLEKASELEVLSFIEANTNAIGYISMDARIPANVKVLVIT